MLNRKQIWRRQLKSVRRYSHKCFPNHPLYNERPEKLSRSRSEPILPNIDNEGSEKVLILKKWNTFDDMKSLSEKTSRKCLTFDNVVRTVLIPTRDEYEHAGVRQHIWYDYDDFVLFKAEATSELNNFKNLFNLTLREARRYLYQPEHSAGSPNLPSP